jgi:capsular exopolysaccharide synthesis family protein
MQEPTVIHHEPEPQSTTHIVHVLMQFVVAVRHRKHVLLAALAVAALLAGLYYATATRYYSAKASLLVLNSGSDMTASTIHAEGSRHQGLMPTYESLVTQDEVLKGALKLLTRPEDRIDLVDVPEEKWTKVLGRNLSARTVPNTNLIKIDYCSKDPGAAVHVVNAVVHSYLEFMERTHKGTASEILQVFDKQWSEVRDQQARTEAYLRMAREEVGVFGRDAESTARHPDVQAAARFNEKLIETQEELRGLEGTLSAVQAAVARGEDLQQVMLDVEAVVGKEMLLAALGFNSSDASNLATLERDLIDARARLRKLDPHFGPKHPDWQFTLDRIREYESYLSSHRQKVDERLAEIQHKLGPMLTDMLRQKLDMTRSREAALRAQFDQARSRAVRLTSRLAEIDSLEREEGRLWAERDELLRQIQDIRLQHEGADMRAVVVSQPVRIDRPVSPNLRRVGFLALIAGLGIGLLAVYVLDILDDRFRTVEEMQAQLRAPALAMVRQLSTESLTGMESLQMYSHPDAAESEAFRTLRTALSLSEHPAHRMVISSAEPGDGKTTVLANLAVSYAQTEKRTLLIDADLRRPGLTSTLGFKSTGGLSTIIRSTGEVAEIAASNIRASGIEGLDVLPSGPRPSNPAELLSSPRFADLLGWAETVYDRVLVDSPPALAASDTAIIGRLVDGVILVVQPDKNRRRLVIRAAESLSGLKIRLLGVVINRVGSQKDGGYYGYGGAYDYDYGADRESDNQDDKPADALDVAGAVPDQSVLGELTRSEPDASVGIVPHRQIV